MLLLFVYLKCLKGFRNDRIQKYIECEKVFNGTQKYIEREKVVKKIKEKKMEDLMA